MMRPRSPLVHLLFVALYLAAPALAAALSGSNDAANSGFDNPGLDVTRNAMPPPDVTRPAERQAVGANPLWAVPLSGLAATRDRPLFTPSRHTPAPVGASVPVAAPRPPPSSPPVPQHPNLTLVGTVAGENEGVAVFIDTATRDTVRLRTGEDHSGWILQSVERRAATLQKGGQSETLAMPKPTETQAPAPVVTALPPPPPPPPQSSASPPAPQNAPGNPPPAQGCMPQPVGC